jgi:hypothetical protein
MIEQIAEACVGALFGGLTVLCLMLLFLALCVVMKAIAFVLTTELDELKLPW